ncbi:MAG: nucleotidyltransferase family protein [Candidatus Omnitrophica bacterium]|nr:nucleotidyltransferase family protein [Candidatus Omnitrophota bacterium]
MRRRARKFLSAKVIINILKEHRDILKKYKVKKIALFGSYVRGEGKEGSDIDFLVEFKEPNFDNFMNLVFWLENLFGKRVDILTPISLETIRVKEVAEEIKKSLIYV